jgi:hypothetical protein
MKELFDLIALVAKMSAAGIMDWMRDTAQIAVGLVLGWLAWRFVKGDH